MDDFLLLLILDHISGGAYRGAVNVVGFFIVVGAFLAHPLLGILGLMFGALPRWLPGVWMRLTADIRKPALRSNSVRNGKHARRSTIWNTASTRSGIAEKIQNGTPR